MSFNVYCSSASRHNYESVQNWLSTRNSSCLNVSVSMHLWSLDLLVYQYLHTCVVYTSCFIVGNGLTDYSVCDKLWINFCKKDIGNVCSCTPYSVVNLLLWIITEQFGMQLQT